LEEWRDITGYEGYYQVSSKGNVKSLDRTLIDSTGVTRRIKGRQLTPFITNIGYLQVKLMKSGKSKHMYVHRLVSKEFISNPMNYNEVNHIDYNKENNCVENLEWCTHLYNMIDLRDKKYGGYEDSHNHFHINKCIDCGKTINYESTRCNSCAVKRRVKYKNKKSLTKEEINNSLIKTNGNFTESSKDFNMTDNALRKWCKKYNLPTHSRDWRAFRFA